MSVMQRAVSAYGQASHTLAPIQQVVMLYDGAIRKLKEARAAIEERRVAARFAAVSRAVAIVEGLQAGLDHEQGGEIARNLDRIYTHVVFRLHRLNLTDDVAICDELLARMGELRAAWAELAGERAPPVEGAGRTRAAALSAASHGSSRVTI